MRRGEIEVLLHQRNVFHHHHWHRCVLFLFSDSHQVRPCVLMCLLSIRRKKKEKIEQKEKKEKVKEESRKKRKEGRYQLIRERLSQRTHTVRHITKHPSHGPNYTNQNVTRRGKLQIISYLVLRGIQIHGINNSNDVVVDH